ncbi:MAG: AMP-binding protein [Planctomycetes bacterium]|nr:AMP-binding protein [Planctomycetota bacterium]
MSDAGEALLDARLRRTARVRGEAPALTFVDGPAGDLTLTWTALDAAVERAAGVLAARDLPPGARVLLQLGKGPAFVLLHLACLRLGLVTLPVHEAATADERSHHADDADAALLVLEDDDPHAGRPVLVVARDTLFDGAPERPDASAGAPRPDDLACLLYTSGTTGRPKGARLLQRNLFANAAALHAAWGWSERDTLLHVLPLFHVHGLFVALHGALFSGAHARLLPRFDEARVWTELGSGAISVFMAVPTMYHRLLGHAPSPVPDLSAVRLLTSGSAPLRPDEAHAFAALTGKTLLERYGMTEVLMAASQALHGERRPGGIGRELPGVTIRVVDPETLRDLPTGEVGELLVRGPAVCDGYWRRPEETRAATTADGFFRSGDLGRRDAHGELELTGRRKELVISGGFNVSPREVEAVLDAHPDVSESAVAGAPDADLGERVVAAVVARDGTRPAVDDLLRHCRAHLAPYKVPRALVLVDALPRNPMGKVVRARVAALCGPGPGS